MTKKMLEGTLDEQCAFLYDLALSKMKTGNYTGALYALKEVARHRPNYRDVSSLLVHLQKRKRDQRRLILVGLCSGILLATLTLAAGVTNDLLVVGAGVLGLVGGYVGYMFLEKANSKSSAGLSRSRNIFF